MPGKSVEIAEQNTTTGGLAVKPSESLVNYLQRVAADNVTNRSYDVAASQLDRMIMAETLDDIMDADEQGTLQARDLVGLEFDALDFDFKTSTFKSDDKFDSAFGVYIQFPGIALMDFPTRGISRGDSLLISTGAPLVIGKLRSLNAGGFLPMPLLIAGIDAPNGTVLKLRRVPARA